MLRGPREIGPPRRPYLGGPTQLGQATIIRKQYRLPVIAVDYCAPGDDVCASDTVRKICKDGLVPYVADGALMTVGIGRAGICEGGAAGEP